MAQSFGSWLKAQRDRDDPVGDLAQDFIRDIKRTPYKRPSDWSPHRLRVRLQARQASAMATSGFRIAVAEWHASR
jgi:hypothetical protein